MNNISTCDFLKTAGGSVIDIDFFKIANISANQVKDELTDNNKSNVFFTNDISVRGLLKIYSYINSGISGRVGIKLHTGEPHDPNLLLLDLLRDYKLKFLTVILLNVTYYIQVHVMKQLVIVK